MMSLGSDAHKPDQIGSGLQEAAEILQRAGINQAAIFQNGRRSGVAMALT